MSTKIKRILEPKASTIINGYETIYEFYLPQVNQDKVNVRKVGGSLELRAVKRDTLYFKILKAPKESFISDKSFKNDIFRVVVKNS